MLPMLHKKLSLTSIYSIQSITMELERQTCQKTTAIVFPEKQRIKKERLCTLTNYDNNARMIACNMDPTYISCSPPESTFMMNLKKRMNEY